MGRESPLSLSLEGDTRGKSLQAIDTSNHVPQSPHQTPMPAFIKKARATNAVENSLRDTQKEIKERGRAGREKTICPKPRVITRSSFRRHEHFSRLLSTKRLVGKLIRGFVSNISTLEPHHCRHDLPQFTHVQNRVIGSSALRVCASV